MCVYCHNIKVPASSHMNASCFCYTNYFCPNQQTNLYKRVNTTFPRTFAKFPKKSFHFLEENNSYLVPLIHRTSAEHSFKYTLISHLHITDHTVISTGFSVIRPKHPRFVKSSLNCIKVDLMIIKQSLFYADGTFLFKLYPLIS